MIKYEYSDILIDYTANDSIQCMIKEVKMRSDIAKKAESAFVPKLS